MTGLPAIGALIKISQSMTSMSKRDLLLVGFIFLFILSFGVLTGYIPSPLLTMAAQHEKILADGAAEKKTSMDLLEVARLQLYLARENCMHGAETESEKSRCDRESVRDAIFEGILIPPTAMSSQMQ